MKRQAREVFRWWLLSTLLVLLAACASGGPLVTPGATTAGGGLTIDAGMEWTPLSGMETTRTTSLIRNATWSRA